MTSTFKTVAVIGAGTMGVGIAQVAASAGHTVLLFDINKQALEKAKISLNERLYRRVQQGKVGAQSTNELLARITLVYTLTELAPAQLVIEAVAEKLAVKQAIFGELERICLQDTLFASNTSSLSITAIASQLKYPERLAGLHFFNPAPVMKLVEVIHGRETTDAVIEQLKTLTLSWGKIPVICRSTPGFIVNRVARPFYAETLRALEEKIADPATLDSVLRDAGGFSMGPLQLTDLIGHDVNYAVTNSIFQASGYDPRFQTSFEQLELVQAGHLGRKTGCGFYHYGENKTLSSAKIAEKVILNNPLVVTARGDWQTFPEFAQLLRQNEILLEESKSDCLSIPTLLIDNVIVMLTNGELSSVLAQRLNQSVVQFDLSADYAQATIIAISCAMQNSHQDNQTVIAFFQSLNKDVIVLPDYPGLLTLRTVAMLCNEALDVVNKGIASPEDTDNAMRYGVNYPKGPLTWGKQIGWQNILNTLEQLTLFYADGRYRANPLLRQLAAGYLSLPNKELQ
ncbi:3-hydroxyacyl-CoA dehydrogenase [Providencia burhodogranariea]|uniref:3-hydroxybutyryl-CoA dehydrogenase n=1 Tax=Providencia burhodogranariea DSM 19968 TaxID=1141662 RepID=K8W9I8_9GAMM|nr:3-hydroxybutyryl-CoA dehydrogenase [Providencia burhodogranariea DSM 19968]